MRVLLKLFMSLVFLFTAAISFAQTFHPPDQELSILKGGLVGYWPFDEMSGTMAYDFSSNGNHGVLDGVSWVAGKVGDGALHFDGVSNVVKVPHGAYLVFTDQLTIAAWIYLASTDGNQDAIQKYGIALCEIRADKAGIISNILKVNNVWTGFVYNDNSDYFLNQWYHLALTYDGTQVVNYLDGQVDKTFEQTGEITVSAEGESDLSIGSNAPWNDCYFNGIIDDVRLYNRALSSSEMENLFHGVTAIEQSGITAHPGTFELCQNYPNPFNNSTVIEFNLKEQGNVSLKVYNHSGQEVASLIDGEITAGSHKVPWVAVELASGIYFYTISVDGFKQTRKLLFLK